MRTLCIGIVILGYAMGCLVGCENPNAAARSMGQPVGGALSIPQSVTEGVAEGYAGGDPEPNPYGR